MAFYTYMHTRNDTGMPFYIGKGTRNRAFKACKGQRSEHWLRISSKYGHTVHLLAAWKKEEDAFSHEILLIACMKDLGIPLVNKTNGGEGAAGFKKVMKPGYVGHRKGVFLTDEIRKKISIGRKGIPSHRKGVILSDEIKLKISLAKSGRLLSEDHKDKLGKPVQCVETGIIFSTATKAAIFLKELGYKKALHCGILRSCKKERKKAYGFTWIFYKEK